MNVGLGVDGSASNDGSHLLAEVRQAMLLSRVKEGITGYSLSNDPNRRLMTARGPLWLGTAAGRRWLVVLILGRLKMANVPIFTTVDMNKLDFAGALHDPVSALVFCQPVKVDYTVVGGKFVVKEGKLVTVDERRVVVRNIIKLQRGLLNG